MSYERTELKLLEAIVLLQERQEITNEHILHELRLIRHELTPKRITSSIAVKFTGATTMNSLVLNIGQSSTASIVPLSTDGVTPSGGVVSAATYSFSDPSATLTDNGDGTASIVGVAAGSASGSVSCTVTDTDSAVSTWTQAFTVSVNTPPPPTQLTQSIGISFTTPTP